MGWGLRQRPKGQGQSLRTAIVHGQDWAQNALGASGVPCRAREAVGLGVGPPLPPIMLCAFLLCFAPVLFCNYRNYRGLLQTAITLLAFLSF